MKMLPVYLENVKLLVMTLQKDPEVKKMTNISVAEKIKTVCDPQSPCKAISPREFNSIQGNFVNVSSISCATNVLVIYNTKTKTFYCVG